MTEIPMTEKNARQRVGSRPLRGPRFVILHSDLVRIYEAGRLKGELEDHEELHGDPVLPGFVVRVGDLMPQSPTSKN